MNIKTTTLLTILVTFALSCKSVAAEENGLLWRISGNGLTQSSYLFGTHHMVPVSFLETVSGLSEAFESTQQVVGELDMSNPAAMMQLQIQMMHYALMPEGVTYHQLLSEDDIYLLDNTLTDLLGVGLAQFGTFNPAMLSYLISLTRMAQYFPEMAEGTSIDQYFQEQAVLRSRPVRALDTVESQLHAMFGISTVERQAELLVCMLHHPDEARELMERVNELYYAFDLMGLYAMAMEEEENSPCPSTDEERHALTRDRHLRCIDRLSEIIQEKSSFIAVGALHLPGEYGLIEGLRRAGFTVTAVQ